MSGRRAAPMGTAAAAFTASEGTLAQFGMAGAACFIEALTRAGWMAALVPPAYGGSGLGLAEASVIMEEINRRGGNSGACHGQMHNMGTLPRHGSAEQKQRWLPKIACGELRQQSMGVTEPTTGTDTTQIKTSAVRRGGRCGVNGRKVWISHVQHADLMIRLARRRRPMRTRSAWPTAWAAVGQGPRPVQVPRPTPPHPPGGR